MKKMAKVRGLVALVSTTNDGKKRMEFVNRDFNAAIIIRRCAVMEKKTSTVDTLEFCWTTSQSGTI
jgi:hypothetical protein